MRPIPQKIRDHIDGSKFFKQCVITGSRAVSIEHCWSYGKGGQINEIWALIPLRRDLNTSHPPKDVKDRCRLISLYIATDEELKKYPKKDWAQIKKYLTGIYGVPDLENRPSDGIIKFYKK